MLEPMGTRWASAGTCAGGVGRLVALSLLLIGLLGMHGVSASGTAVGVHHHPVTTAAPSVLAAPGLLLWLPAGAAAAPAGNNEGAEHAGLTGCLLALTGLVAFALVVRAPAVRRWLTAATPLRSVPLRLAPPVPPPRRGRPRISLCVVRV
jgi:hypothetical protein